MMTSKSVEKTLDTFQCMFNEIKAIPVQLEKLQSENLQLSKDIDKLKDANRNAAAHKHKLKETQAEVEELRMEKDMLQEKVDYLNKQAEELKKNRQKARGETSEFGDRRYQEHQLQEQLNEANTQIHDIQHELDETKLRLSKALGKHLKNRTTKLDERYSELYDNQWTDAFDVFEKQGMTEEEVIRLLLKILQDVYDFCQTKSLEQLQSIKQAMLIKDTSSGREIPSLRLKKYLDCRKEVGEESGKAVLEEYLGTLKSTYSSGAKKALQVQPYVEECALLCWLMCLQDPPVVLDSPRGRGESFESEMYRAYTKNGKKIEFLVWPAMLLHEDGNVLCKGVAQCYDPLKKDYLENDTKRKDLMMENYPFSDRKRKTSEKVYPPSEINQYGSARATGYNESSRNHAYHFESSYLGYRQSNDDLDRSNLGGQSPTRRSNMNGITDQDMDDFFFYRKRWSDDHDKARSRMGKERYDRCREYYYKTYF